MNVFSYSGVDAGRFIGMTLIAANNLAKEKGIELTSGTTLFSNDDRERLDHKFVKGSENKLSVVTVGATQHPNCRFCLCYKDGPTIVKAAFGKYRAFNEDGSVDYS